MWGGARGRLPHYWGPAVQVFQLRFESFALNLVFFNAFFLRFLAFWIVSPPLFYIREVEKEKCVVKQERKCKKVKVTDLKNKTSAFLLIINLNHQSSNIWHRYTSAYSCSMIFRDSSVLRGRDLNATSKRWPNVQCKYDNVKMPMWGRDQMYNLCKQCKNAPLKRCPNVKL